MLDWCLAESIEPNGAFKLNDESTLGGAFYFGVSFLDQVGYFNKKNRFWTDEEFPEAPALKAKIRNRLLALNIDDPEAMWALWTLQIGG